MIEEIRYQHPAISATDVSVKAKPGKVFWVNVFAGATGGAWQLNDSTDDSGTDRFSDSAPANSSKFIAFDPPLRFDTGIYLDIPGTNVTVTVGFN